MSGDVRKPYYGEPPAFVDGPVTAWEQDLADALLAILGAGTHDLDGIVDGLNGTKVKPPEGDSWTADRFTSVVHKIGW